MLRFILASITAFLILHATFATAESAKPSWHCLPAETAVALRVPDGDAFYSAMQATAIGRHLFSEERIGEFIQILQREAGDDWTTFRKKLGELGMEPEDFPKILRGESGAALIVNPPGDRDPGETDLYVLFWANPGEELGDRLMEGMLQTLGEGDSEYPTRRVDLDLAGHNVIHLAVPQTFPGTDGERVVTHNAHNFLTRIDGRLVGVMTLMSGPDFSTVRRALEDDSIELAEPEPEPSEAMLGLFARFLRAHEGEDGDFRRELMATPGLREALPRGVPGFELAVNPDPFFRMASDNEDPKVRRILEGLGLFEIGNIAFRGALDGSTMRWGGLISAPSPRRGIVETLLDQRELSPRPPAWVPATVTDYTQASLDLGELYSRIKEVVIDVMGDQAEQGIAQMEMQVRSMVQEDIATTLSSIGHHHSFVMFPSDASVDPAEQFRSGDVFSDRMAFVWSPRNEEVWQRIMQSIAMFAPMTGGALQRSEEQGFAGWRVEQEMFQGGLFLGRGFLALGLGRGTVEEVLSGLRRPPEGTASLAGSDLYRDSRRLMDARPGLHWEIQDLGHQMRDLARLIQGMLEIMKEEDDTVSPEAVNQLAGILDPDVIGEAFGTGVSQSYATRDGLLMESAQELTPAQE